MAPLYGAWTIVQSQSVSPEAIAQQFLDDFRAGEYIGLGSSTLGALKALAAGGHWALVGIQGERAAGNGASMRSAPLAFLLDFEKWSDKQTFRDVVRITHRNEEALAGAQIFALSLQYLMSTPGTSLNGLLTHLIAKSFDSQTRDNLLSIQHVSEPSYSALAQTIGTSGFVAHSVPMALVGFMHGLKFGISAMFETIVNEGGDTDTIASMAGQLLGVVLGYDALPCELLEQLPTHSHLNESFSLFAKLVAGAT